MREREGGGGGGESNPGASVRDRFHNFIISLRYKNLLLFMSVVYGQNVFHLFRPKFLAFYASGQMLN